MVVIRNTGVDCLFTVLVSLLEAVTVAVTDGLNFAVI
jgi:hypothetical protein